jgi:hypothetical protein
VASHAEMEKRKGEGGGGARCAATRWKGEGGGGPGVGDVRSAAAGRQRRAWVVVDRSGEIREGEAADTWALATVTGAV